MTDPLEVEVEVLERVCAGAVAMLGRLAEGGAADRDEAATEFTARIEAVRREVERRHALGAHEADVVVSTALARALRAAGDLRQPDRRPEDASTREG